MFEDLGEKFDDMFDIASDNPSETLTVIFGTLFGLLIVVGILYLIVVGGQKISDSRYPVKSKTAKVLYKEDNGVYVLFETEDGERLRLRVKAQNKLLNGDMGILTWQGGAVVNFQYNAHKNKKVPIAATTMIDKQTTYAILK